MEFKKGDVVILKSGGPIMTVEYYDEESGLVGCVWFSRKIIQKDSFEPVMLIKNNDTCSDVVYSREN